MTLRDVVEFVLDLVPLAGLWLIWDWHNSFLPYISWSRWTTEWSFTMPFGLSVLTWKTQGLPFDVALFLTVVATVVRRLRVKK